MSRSPRPFLRPARVLAVGAALVAAVALAGCSSGTDAAGASGTDAGTGAAPGGATTAASGTAVHLSGSDFTARIGVDGTVLIDVRTPDEYATGHIAGAALVDYEAAGFVAGVQALADPTTPVALYCRSGNRSGQALADLVAAGYTDVADLDGGISAWTGALVTG